jgi:drug/metabolite transporter (DMT)-like permease
MNAVSGSAYSDSQALAAKNKVASQFFRKGIVIALFSGVMYGFYSAFLTLGMSKGVWADWYGAGTVLSAFAVTYLLGALGSAVNDTASAGWALLNVGVKGKLGDFFRTLKTKPGRVMILAALVGGPISSTAYVVGLQMAGSIVIPITALCPAIGAILGRLLFKQQLNKRMMLGILICVIASFMIGSTSIGSDAPEGMFLGICIAFIAALGWGFEGAVAGYGTSMIDYEISITIRQVISGLSNLIILVPIFGLLAGDIGLSTDLAVQAFTSGPAMIWIAIAGFCAWISYMFWYRGNSMCGAALGMACNGTFSFWGPFCCWIVLGVIFGIEGWSIPPIAWVAAVIMVFGILMIAMNPLDLFKRGNKMDEHKIAS